MESTTCTPMSPLHGRHPVSTVDRSVFRTAGKPVTQGRKDDLVKDTVPTARCLRRSSPRNSPPCAEGVYLQNYTVNQQKLQISPALRQIPHVFLVLVLEWKVKFKTEVRAGSGSPWEAMLWIKEVDTVDTIDDLTSSRSVQRHHFPNFEMLDMKIPSALNKIIPNSYFRNRVSLEKQRAQTQDRFLKGRQIAFMFCGCFRVTGAHDTVLDYADLFTLTVRTTMFRNSIRSGTKLYYR